MIASFMKSFPRSQNTIFFMIVKKLLLLSHGQATVERGFLFNKEVTANHLSQLALKARRTVIDHIHSVGGLLEVQIDKGILRDNH